MSNDVYYSFLPTEVARERERVFIVVLERLFHRKIVTHDDVSTQVPLFGRAG